MIAAHWACPLMFARSRVHKCTHGRGEAEPRGNVIKEAKVTKKLIFAAHGDNLQSS